MVVPYKTTSALRKGCFVHKPAKLKRRKSTHHISHIYKDYGHQDLWDKMALEIQEIEKKAFKKTFDAVVKFANNCFKYPLEEMDEIPAAVLLMGVNMPDHSNIFHLLEDHMASNEIFASVILESRKCCNLSNMIQTIHAGLMSKFEKHLKIEEPVKKQDCSFAKLYSYYQSFLSKQSAIPMKQVSESSSTEEIKPKPIVFLIQDVETYNVEVLQELILNCKIYSGKLPIVLVFGMASAMVTLHNILPQRALCCLGVETFHSVPATEYLTRIVEEVVISPEKPFKIGPRVFHLITDTVLYHDFSILNLTNTLKFSVIEHFHHKYIATFCCHESALEERVENISNKELQVVASLPSFKMYKDNNPDIASSLNNVSDLKACILYLLKKLFIDQKLNMVLLRVLHCLTGDLPRYPLGKQLRELYSFAIEKKISDIDAFIEAQNLLKMQSQNELISKFKVCLEILKDTSQLNSVILNEAMKSIQSSIEKLSSLSSGDFEKKIQEPINQQNDKIMSRFQLQEKMRSSIKVKRSKFETLRSEIIDDFFSFFSDILPPSQMPLHEIFYFDDAASLKRHLMPVPRVIASHALSDPQQYLRCKCCKITASDEIQLTMPDICVLYKLHLECGKLINLCDWLEAFKSVKKNGTNVMTKTKDDSKLNIRFLQAASELQFLGFIKPTKRKTDHVGKLTFGSF